MPAAVFVVLLTWLPGVLAGRSGRRDRAVDPAARHLPLFRLDALALLLALIVTGVGALVLLYCTRYFADDEPALGRFAALLLAFAGSMLGLVTADDVFLLFMFWEATSVLSYLLIGHYTGRKESRGAALQALTVTTFGGLAMLVGLVMLTVAGRHHLARRARRRPGHGHGRRAWRSRSCSSARSRSARSCRSTSGCPAAMAAPTPVSAYLHAAAMVKAGVYLVARLAPGYADLAGVASDRHRRSACSRCSSAAGARCASTTSSSLLAYGTVSQLGFLVLVIGLRHARRGARGRRAAARARAVQGDALPRGRHRRPRGRHARLAQALRARPADAA